MLKIGIDTFSFDRPGENFGVGPGVYVWHLLEHLLKIGTAHEFYVIVNRDNLSTVPSYPHVHVLSSPVSNRKRALRPLHEQIVVPSYVSRYKLDGVHSLGNTISFPVAHRSILTVYDLMWKYYRDRGDHSAKSHYFAVVVPRALRKARGLITISKFIADEVRQTYGIPGDRISAIPLAPGTLHPPDPAALSRIFGEVIPPYLFSVTTSFPHKNLRTLIDAFVRLKREGRFAGKLIVAGQLKGPFLSAAQEAVASSGCGEDVYLLGFVDEGTKSALYEKALAVVYPSLYEGFGLPVLEAMQAGTPVICSSRASIGEVAGDAAVLFDPTSAEDVAAKVDRVVHDPALRTMLIEKGKKRVLSFSWEKTARSTLDVYEHVFRASGNSKGH
jgi:glycosyltransferase involved in cell wall biosynthesis